VLAELAARDPKTIVINHARNFARKALYQWHARGHGGPVILLDGDLPGPAGADRRVSQERPRGLT